MTRCTETYEVDYYAWTQEQVRALRQAAAARVNLDLDFDHLAEEVEDLGNSERFAVESAVIRVIEHFLKLEHSPAVDPRAGWEDSVTEHRIRIARKLAASPSLEQHLEEMLRSAWRHARRLALRGLQRDGVDPRTVPAECPYTLDQIRDEDWWPDHRQ